MKKRTLEKAIEITRHIDKIDDAIRIINVPYPYLYDENAHGAHGSHVDPLCFASFDETTCKALKQAMINTLKEQRDRLEDELESL